MDVIKSRELNIKEIFDIGATIYKKNANFILLYCIVLNAIMVYLINFLADTLAYDINGVYEDYEYLGLTDVIVNFIVIILLIIIASSMYLIFARMAMNSLYDRSFNLKDALTACKKMPKYMLTSVFYLLIILPAFIPIGILLGLFYYIGSGLLITLLILLIFLAIYILLGFSFYPFIIAHSNIWGFKSLFRSRRLIKGNWLKTLLVFFISVVGTGMFFIISDFVLNLVGQNPIFDIILQVISTLLSSYFLICFIVWFLNRNYNYILETEGDYEEDYEEDYEKNDEEEL